MPPIVGRARCHQQRGDQKPGRHVLRSGAGGHLQRRTVPAHHTLETAHAQLTRLDRNGIDAYVSCKYKYILILL